MRFRTILHIALRHLRSRPFQTVSVIAVVAFSCALAVSVFLLAQGLRLGVTRAVEPFDLIVGTKGSSYQLFLNTVFLQDTPAENLAWEDYTALVADSRVAFAVPLGLGDNYKGYPVIGTTAEIRKIRISADAPPWMQAGKGRWFTKKFEAVLGSQAASESGLDVGDTLRTSHGLIAGNEHGGEFRIVGTAIPTRSPYDRAIFIPLENIWAEHAGHKGTEDAGEVTAILVHPRSYADAYSLAAAFQQDRDKQLIFPAQTAIRLFSLLGRGEDFLSILVVAVAGCALVTTLLILYWSGAAREKERMLLYVLGASPNALRCIAWLEGTMMIAVGTVLGALLGRAGVSAAFMALGNASGLDSSVPLTLEECLAPLALLLAGTLGSLMATRSNTAQR